ncbi:MAG: L-fucose/L-arabinose isomerase family protein [Acidimicrobiales bacterium]
MARVGILSFSDGRDFVHRDLASFVAGVEERIAAACEGFGAQVVRGTGPITSNEAAVREGRRLADMRPDLTIFNYPVWAFPHFSVHAARATAGPLLLFSNIDPTYPGMVSLLAAGGSLDQLGRRHERLWGEVEDPAVAGRLRQVVAAAHAVRSLEGSTFARVGGRSMGMYTAVGRTDEWMRRFGIDVEEVDQLEVVRRSELVPAAQAAAGRQWLEKYTAGVHYDGKVLTPETLERQVRSYYALKEILEEGHIDFCGIKGQPELTNYFATTDIAEAFLNDPYDFDGPKQPVICATEDDMDGALTMLLMHKVTGTPALFADVRHYFAKEGIWDLENSGQHATWFAARSDDPAENLAKVELYPEDWYFPAGGAAVHHLAAPGEVTLARLSRLDARYRLQVTKGRFEAYDDETNEALMRQSNYAWPHAFTRMDAPVDVFLSRFGANHIHAVPGDITAELEMICRFLDIDLERLDQ